MGVVLYRGNSFRKPYLKGDEQGRLTVEDINNLSMMLGGILSSVENTNALVTEIQADCRVMRDAGVENRLQVNDLNNKVAELRREFDPVKQKVDELDKVHTKFMGARAALVVLSSVLTFSLSYIGFHVKW